MFRQELYKLYEVLIGLDHSNPILIKVTGGEVYIIQSSLTKRFVFATKYTKTDKDTIAILLPRDKHDIIKNIQFYKENGLDNQEDFCFVPSNKELTVDIYLGKGNLNPNDKLVKHLTLPLYSIKNKLLVKFYLWRNKSKFKL